MDNWLTFTDASSPDCFGQRLPVWIYRNGGEIEPATAYLSPDEAVDNAELSYFWSEPDREPVRDVLFWQERTNDVPPQPPS
jgi:hypothetical protein